MNKHSESVSPTAARVLRQVADYLLLHPDEYRQDVWVCGTVACIAGHVLCLTQNMSIADLKRLDCDWSPMQWIEHGARALEMPEHRLSRLFDACPDHAWPHPFAREWAETIRPCRDDDEREERMCQRAWIASRRIEHFVMTGE